MSKVRMPKDEDVFEYFTQRSLYKWGDKRKKNWGSTPHKAKVWVFKDEPEIANVEYSCPNCEFKGSKQTPYEVDYSFECDGCKKILKVPKPSAFMSATISSMASTSSVAVVTV